jgi:hypothetical protein
MVRNYLKGFRGHSELHSLAAQGRSWKQYVPKQRRRPLLANESMIASMRLSAPAMPESQTLSDMIIPAQTAPTQMIPQPEQLAPAEALPELPQESHSSETEARPIEERGTEVSYPPALLSYEEGILI